jgi:hypothetical protein
VLVVLTRFSYSVVKDQAAIRGPRSSCASFDAASRNLMRVAARFIRRLRAGIRRTTHSLLVALVEIAGVEPATSGLQSRRSAS